MTRLQRNVFRVSCALVGILVGGLAMMGAAALTRPEPESSARPEHRKAVITEEPVVLAKEPSKLAPKRSILLAWAPGGLPRATERVLTRTDGVRTVATVEAGLDWLESSRSPDGTVIDRTPGGMAIPFENAYIDPESYAEFVSPSERDKVRSLGAGEALLAQTSEELRGGGAGLRLDLKGASLTVAGVVDDVTTGGYEALTAGAAPARWSAVDRFVLIRLERKANEGLVEKRIRSLLDPGQPLRLRPNGVNPFLRYGDAVLPQLVIKKTFGEFMAKPIAGDRFFEIEEAWRNRHIRVERVPVLGEVVCHRAVLPQLRAAMKEVQARDLAYTINPGQYGGCFGPRFLNEQRHRISHHAWGISIDFNVSENPPGIRPNLDRRLVSVMRSHGFTWGGDWLLPDGMHFEWVEF